MDPKNSKTQYDSEAKKEPQADDFVATQSTTTTTTEAPEEAKVTDNFGKDEIFDGGPNYESEGEE